MKKTRSRSLKDKKLSAYKKKFKLSYEKEREHIRKGIPIVTDNIVHPLKKKYREYLRVESQPTRESPNYKLYEREIKPLSNKERHNMKERDRLVKICDMGNACPMDNHYSDII